MLTNHKCSLGLDTNNIILKKRGIWYSIAKYFRKLSQVSLEHPDTFDHYRSYSTVIAEQQRQIFEGGNYVIHPLSQISLYWNSVTSIFNLIHMCVSTYRLGYIIDHPAPPRVHHVDYLLLILHVISLLDIFVKFNTSYPEDYPVNVDMDKRRIACRYIQFWFWVDLVSSIPISFILLKSNFQNKRWLFVSHILPIIKVLRLKSSISSLYTFIKLFTRSYIWHRSIHHIILFTVTMHWSSCFIYTPVMFTYYWLGEVPRGYNTFLTTGDITKCCNGTKYFKALFVCLSTFFGTGFSTYKVNNPDEFLVHSLIILYTSMFMVYTVVFLLKIYMTKYNSTMRYHGLINQVEAYMQQKQFPRPLKKRVCTFYTYKYQGKYYKEDSALDCLSEQLRHEIVMHTCNKFIHEVKVINDLPANVMGELMSYLKPETYLANDLIVRAGDIGDCMYFIAYGTVAIYSLKGAEIAHLEDGDHFGTVALLMKDSKRITTVVAVEITHLYRLDAPYFRQFIMSNPNIRERIETLASKRMHETVVLDEEFRKKQEKKREENILTNRDFTNSSQKEN